MDRKVRRGIPAPLDRKDLPDLRERRVIPGRLVLRGPKVTSDLLDLRVRRVIQVPLGLRDPLVLAGLKDPLDRSDRKVHKAHRVYLELYRPEATSSSWRVIQYPLATPL